MKKSGIKLGVLVICGLSPSFGCIWRDPGTRNPTSDVPCLAPTAWSAEIGSIFLREDSQESAALLLTYYTNDQWIFDTHDQILGNDPHSPVYRFQSQKEYFEEVGDAAWDNLSSEVTDCGAFLNRENPFSAVALVLQFRGQNIAFAGRVVMSITPAPRSPVVAVLSSDGIRIAIIPGAGAPPASGQYFHQLFSALDGKPIGPAVRVAVGGRAKESPRVCWTADEHYVIYEQRNSGDKYGVENLCIVDVSNEIATLQGQ